MTLNPLELIVKKMNVKKQTWVRDEPTDDDITHIIQEGLKSPSPFDPLHLREQVYKDYQAGLAKLLCKRSENAKVLAIVYPNTKNLVFVLFITECQLNILLNSVK